MDSTLAIRQQLVKHLKGGEAFIPLKNILSKISFEDLSKRPGMLPYSLYDLFYHIRFTQKDILEYCVVKNYQTPNWPEAYWPEKSPVNREEWEQLKKEYYKELKEFCDHILDPYNELMAPVRAGTNHSLMREVLLVIEHTAYHSGQMLVLLRNLGLYPAQ